MFRVISSLTVLLFVSIISVTAQTSKGAGSKVNKLGPYELGSTYKELEERPGFKYDESRSKPELGIKAGKIIDKNVFDEVTIQRLIFHKNKLVRVSIIMGDANFTEDQAKTIVENQWGPSGDKQKVGDNRIYMWTGSIGTILILTADGGRQMISLADNDKSHYVE